MYSLYENDVFTAIKPVWVIIQNKQKRKKVKDAVAFNLLK